MTHHVEEIPPGFGRALVLRGGRAIGVGDVATTLTGPVLSEAFGLPIDVARTDGRFRAWLAGDPD